MLSGVDLHPPHEVFIIYPYIPFAIKIKDEHFWTLQTVDRRLFRSLEIIYNCQSKLGFHFVGIVIV